MTLARAGFRLAEVSWRTGSFTGTFSVEFRLVPGMALYPGRGPEGAI
jgi:hypothetical protein